MKAIRTAAGFAAVAIAAAVCSYQEVYAGGYSAPSGIEISVDSLEIDRSDLHGDTLVELPVYIRNNEGFVSLNVVFELDPRLRFDRNSIKSDSNGIRTVNVYKCSDSGNMIAASFEAENRFVDDGKLGTFRVIVPENTEQGTYELAVRESGGDYSTRICTYNKRGADFGIECFSLLQGGTVTVTNNHREPAPTQPPTQQQTQPPPREQQEPAEPEKDPDNEQENEQNNENSQTTTVISTVSTVTAKTIKKATSKNASSQTLTKKYDIRTRRTTYKPLFETSKATYIQTSTTTFTTSTEIAESTEVTTIYIEELGTDYANLVYHFASAAFFVGVCAIVVMEIIKGGKQK